MTLQRVAWTALGLVLTGVGIVGYFVPVMPGTVFLIMALFCFQNGNEKLHAWMLQNPWWGPTLRDWDQNKWISKRVKIIAISCMWVFGLGSCYSTKNPIAYALAGTLCIGGTWYILTRRTKPDLKVVQAEAEKPSARAVNQ